MQFQVRLLAQNNQVSQSVMDAESMESLRAQLAAQPLGVLSIKPLGKQTSTSEGRAGKFSLLLFSQELMALLKAGLSLIEALEGLAEKDTRGGSTQSVIQGLLATLRDGKRLSAAMQAQPAVFPALYVGLIQAAESTSNLPATLERYIQYQQRSDQVRNKIVSASLYPIILLVVGGAVAAFLIGYVVPRFAVVYQGSGRSLPLLSQYLLSWGQLVGQHGKLLLVLLAMCLVAGFFLLRYLLASGLLLKWVQRVPGVGARYQLYLLARLYMTLGMLLEGGLSILPALQGVRTVVPLDWQLRVQLASQQIEAGQPVSRAFTAQRLTTPITQRMLRVGEQTGQLGNMLYQAADFYEGDIARFTERFMKTFEPVLMTAIGVVVGLIVVLLYMPIFDLVGSLQ
jgi:general secretion pathway protein F